LVVKKDMKEQGRSKKKSWMKGKMEGIRKARNRGACVAQ